MTDYIQCGECDWIGTLDETFERKVEEHDGLPPPYRISITNACPTCEREDDFNDVTVCPDCLEEGILKEISVEDGERCPEHAAEHAACENENQEDR